MEDGDTLFEEVWPDLPPETVEMARGFKACTRARKSNTPVQLRRLVLRDWGREKSLREVAGHETRLAEASPDSSVAERLAACRPWVRAPSAQLVPGPTLRPA